MYHFTVIITNSPLAIHRQFTFTETGPSTEFSNWLNSKGLTYDFRYEPQANLFHTIAAVEKELALAADHRFV